jgi:alpha-L-arabinofuranosidase
MKTSNSYKKIVEYESYDKYVTKNDLANLFYVYNDQKNSTHLFYNINRSLVLKGLEDVPYSSYEYYTVKAADTWNSIAYTIYGTINLWWIICKTNNVYNATIEPQEGWVLRILPKDIVNNILNDIRGE